MSALTYRAPALAVLHEKYAKRRRIDEQAPVHARQHIVIHAPVGQVWQSLTDVLTGTRPSSLESVASGCRFRGCSLG